MRVARVAAWPWFGLAAAVGLLVAGPGAGLAANSTGDLEAGSYDFVIVGAGSGGSVLANRLSEIADWKVLLLEAGGEESWLTDVPLLAPLMQVSQYNWGYRTEPSAERGYCLSMTDGRCNWPRGRALGGTSVINFMLYTRGARADYDAWQAAGNPGWSYDHLLGYFLKSENSRLSRQDAGYHARGGYLDVADVPYASRLREPFLRAAAELGYPLRDYNGRGILGFSPVQANLRGGRRVSASKAFLEPVTRGPRRRRNLRVAARSRVTKVLLERRPPRSLRAVGVRYLGADGRPRVARARREVLLCAGALGSPQLLLLSGLGPRDQLDPLGIETLEDLPGVGRNLQDHVSMAALTFLVNDSVSIVESRLSSNPLYALDYILRGRGPLTVPGGAEALAFVDTRSLLAGQSPPAKDYPDIELVLGAGALTGDMSGGLRSLLGLSEQFERGVFAGYRGRDAFSIVPILMRPKSRGRVSLRSADPLLPPRLEANYYQDPEDLATMVRGIKAALKVASTRAFRRFNSSLLPVAFPGCEGPRFASDDYWACVARHVSTTLGHFAGTCRMAPRRQGGVVDARLRVHGVEGLRVADASIMPEIVAGHTCAPTYMIGEKAADLVKQHWGVLAA
ncbi:glucose dehydrogenase [FAD, quinone]-like [Phymastichus coffea]|uniref:glucose dehydrogenase [FAD, quinone]-like n=1 Tax=Phymastichus coffea TaxID=108790 RepID=UPI00273B12D8|nr:glucose dehydrogenase [FAD, quinone]-like [Phymastichus coffea]